MSEKKNSFFSIENIIVFLLLTVFVILEYLIHKKVVFVNDDVWYGTNLVTGEKLNSVKDIWDSQVWHYLNWGGRSINHGVLQFVLLCGDMFANICNVLVSVLLSYEICKLARVKSFLLFAFANVAIFAFNPEPILSMFWESGSVNYLYSAVWIFFFIFLFVRELEDTAPKKLWGIEAWIVPLGLIVGWSNENSGPAAFLIGLGILIYLLKFSKRKPRVWMIEGLVTNAIGCAFMLLSPGNNVRKAYSDASFLDMLEDNFREFMIATGTYLFPIVLFTIITIVIYVLVYKKNLKPFHYALLLFALLMHGAMILSPVYPARSTFHPVVALIIVILSMMGEMLDEAGKKKTVFYIYMGAVYLWSILQLVQYTLVPVM